MLILICVCSVHRLCIVSFCIGSYLDYPRIHFSGKFVANSNTVNNEPKNYNLSLPSEKLSPGWNPSGGNEFSLLDCTITSVVYINGSTSTNPDKEMLIGASVHSNPYSVQGKLVAIDVDLWNKSALFGVTIGVKQSETSKEFAFVGSVPNNSVIHQNAWNQIPCNPSQGPFFDIVGARSASKLTNVNWASVLHSEVLQQLKQVSVKHGGYLSVSLAMYGYIHDKYRDNFTHGWISGSIGYARHREPRFFEGDRLLSFEFVDQPRLSLPKEDPCSGKKYSPLWAYRAPFKIHPTMRKLTVDFSSSFSRKFLGGIRDLGVLYLAILRTNRNQCVEMIGTVDYQDDRCKRINGCIMDYHLKRFHFHLIQSNPLVVLRPSEYFSPTSTTYRLCRTQLSLDNHRLKTYGIKSMSAVMLEQQYYVRPHNHYTFMLEKGENAIVNLYVTSFGRPATGVTIQLRKLNPLVKPFDGLNYNSKAVVDNYGYARFVFHANSIKRCPRGDLDIDGQVYQFIYFVSGKPTYCAGDVIHCVDGIGSHTCLETIGIKVFSDVSIKRTDAGHYSWVDHVQSIFHQYDRLYPVMKEVVNLSNYVDVTKPYVLHLLNFSMRLDISHPNYMPVTRDLSSVKRNMILEWLTKPCYNSTHCFISTTLSESDSERSNNYVKQLVFGEICEKIGSFLHQPPDISFYYKFTAQSGIYTAKSYSCTKELKQSGCSPYIIRYCLQKAFELEFYTIPLYLTSLYSIKPGYNVAAYNIMRSVLMQEMLHMLQAANLLISIGGRPVINSASSAPAYPAVGLPGGVFPNLTVSLKKASLDHIYTVFMALEYPHRVTDEELGVNLVHTQTIGQLYAQIGKCLHVHGNQIFYPNHTSLQVKWPYSNDWKCVYSP